MKRYSEGFTVIEVTIFLAISGAMLMIAFIGTGMAAARQRLSDTTDSFQSYMQAQYDEVVKGVNTRGSSTGECPSESLTAGMSKSCALLGRLLTINFSGSVATSVTSHYVISTTNIGTETTDRDKLQASNLKVVVAGSNEEIKWGAQMYENGATRHGNPLRQRVNRIVFLRVPDSGRVIQLSYRDISSDPTTFLRSIVSNEAEYNLAANPGSTANSPVVAICLRNNQDFPINSPRTAILLGSGGGGGSITTDYEPLSGVCP